MLDIDSLDNGPLAAVVLNTLLTHYNIGLLWADGELRLRYVSENIFSLLAPAPEHPVSTLYEICPELVGYEEILKDVAQQRSAPFQIEFINRGESEINPRYINVTAYPAPAPDGLAGVLVLVEDTTSLGIIAQDLRDRRNQMILLKKGYR